MKWVDFSEISTELTDAFLYDETFEKILENVDNIIWYYTTTLINLMFLTSISKIYFDFFFFFLGGGGGGGGGGLSYEGK